MPSRAKHLEFVRDVLAGVLLVAAVVDMVKVFGIYVVFTYSRVTVIDGSPLYFYGSAWADIVLLLSLIVAVAVFSLVCEGVSRRVLASLALVTVSFASVALFGLSYVVMVILVLLALSVSLLSRVIDTVIYGLGVIEFSKILYIVWKAITGLYPRFFFAVAANIALWYVSWFLIPLSLWVFFVMGSLSLLVAVTGSMILRSFLMRIGISRIWVVSPVQGKLDLNVRWLVLISFVIGALIGSIPYLPTLNPDFRPVTTDWVYYYRWLNDLLGGDFSVLVAHFDRVLFLMMLYCVSVITRADPYVLSVIFNVPILGIYAASVTYLTYRRFGVSAALYAAILTPFSPMFLSFIYGGFQANLAALSIILVAIALMSNGNKRELVASMVLMLVSMFVHRWTWIQYILIFSAYTLLLEVKSVLRGEGLDPRVRLLAPYIVASLGLDFTLQAFFPGYGLVRSARTFAYTGYLGQDLLGNYWWMINIYTGASLNHLPYYLLALVAVPAIELMVTDVAVLTSLAPFLALGNVISYRVLINSPLPVFSSYGVARLNPRLRLFLVIVVVGLGLFRLITMIPGLPLV